jgi:hypothetical protein
MCAQTPLRASTVSAHEFIRPAYPNLAPDHEARKSCSAPHSQRRRFVAGTCNFSSGL